jgi:Family of unknown function (DUF6220)
MSDSVAATSSPAPAGGTGFTGLRGFGLKALPPLAMLYLGLGVVQIFLAGYGVFALDGEQLGTKGETAFGPHRFVGTVMMAVALLLLIAALIARPGRTTLILAVSLLLIVAVLQSVLASAGEDTPLFGGLHALFGIGSLGLASALLARSRRLSTARSGLNGSNG